MARTDPYHEPLALIIISSISIGIAAVAALYILLDIILRRGWRSMMLIMIPVYVVNALYLWPITLWTYILYGRPPKPSAGETAPSCHQTSNIASMAEAPEKDESQGQSDHHLPPGDEYQDQQRAPVDPEGDAGQQNMHETTKRTEQHDQHSCAHHHSGERPMFATVTVAVCHCGAGCVLGDIIGEWIVYGSSATINGEGLWVNYLVDFALAIAFGIVFQHYFIAPMSGDYGIKTLIRAGKANFLSLVFFEVGLFLWMAIFQIAIFKWQLPMTTVTYWWMMQIGMFCGHWTGVPINWLLIKKGVKEPCT